MYVKKKKRGRVCNREKEKDKGTKKETVREGHGGMEAGDSENQS